MPSWTSSLPREGLLFLAQAGVEKAFVESLLWGILILGGVIVVFIAGRFIKGSVERKARSQEIPFGITTSDIDRLKTDAGVTPDSGSTTTPDSGTGRTDSGTGFADAGTGGNPSEDSGCGCSTTSTPADAGLALGAIALLGLALALRRRA